MSYLDASADADSQRLFVHKPLLRPEERALWRLFVMVNATLQRQLDDSLREHESLSLAEIEILYELVRAPANRLRQGDLAQRLAYSRGGVTRLVDKLEAKGWVLRNTCDEDARGIYANLTRRGFEKLEAAALQHVATIRSLFLEPLSGEQNTMHRLLKQLQIDDTLDAERSNNH
jgi:DNA-binding MarR family transcriptional regulator